MSDQATILLIGSLCAVCCAIPGTFLVLRHMALLGDAISHAVLPGIAAAFLLTNEVTALPIVVGAGVVGLLTVFLIESLVRTRRVKEDASIAVVFPALFSVGVLLIAQLADQKDLDQDCVLYGEIALAPLETVAFGGMHVARALVVLAPIALLNVLFVALLWKELKLATFDAALAASVGISPVVVHYLLMGTVSFTTVATFESVGAILVVAFLIVPAATAHLLTDRLGRMLALSCGIGVLSAVVGYFVARRLDASIAGCMAAAMGALFVLTWLLAPRQGILGRILVRRRARDRFASALVLERLRREPVPSAALATDLAWPPERVDQVLDDLRRNGLVDGAPTPSPTRAGLAFIDGVLRTTG